MDFDFSRIQAGFKMLLPLDWQPSQTKGWHRVPKQAVQAAANPFMIFLNQNCGYEFGKGTSPTLGETILINPLPQSGHGQFGSPASASFVSAVGQVQANHHSTDKAANALTLNAYLQDTYHKAGVLQKWGQWSLGVNPQHFNSFRLSRTPQETEFMRYASDLIGRQARKTGTGLHSEFSIRYSGGYLKIRQTPDLEKTWKPLQDNLISMIGISQSKPQELSKEYNKILEKSGLKYY